MIGPSFIYYFKCLHLKGLARSGRGLLCLIFTFFLILGPERADPPPQDLDLGRYKGKVVYLDFWASWCGPCRQSFPYMEHLAARYGTQGLAVVAVNLDHSRPQAEAFLKDLGVSGLEVIYDADRQLAKGFAITDMPSSVLIGRDGRVRYVHSGFFPEQRQAYESHVAELINEK